MTGKREKRNSRLYYADHQDVGHDTENCYVSKKEIENLIRQDYLRQFVKDDSQRGYREDH